MDPSTLPRHVTAALLNRLRVMPAVLVMGARQTGKSTLAQRLVPGPRRYLTLDDLDILDAARRDPESLLGRQQPMTLDEVQREPGLLRAVKQDIDKRRQAGRFLLAGSANLPLMHQVSETLAGRLSHLLLWPMTRREQLGLGRCGLWEELHSTPPDDWIDLLRASPDEPADWRALARRGGYPTPALQLQASRDRTIWFDGYVRTYLERDLQAVSSISALPDFRRLMKAACLRLGQLVNQTELGRAVSLSQPTVHRWLNLLETSFVMVRLPAFAVNRTKRLIKSPKLYWCDVGLAVHLAGGGRPTGSHLENLVLHDLLVWRDARDDTADVFYWRTTLGEEVDFVIETPDALLPLEVKASGRPRLSDTAALRTFLAEYGDRARAGLLLHGGSTLEWLAPDVLAVPWWRVL